MKIHQSTSQTIACTLSLADLADVGAAWQKLLRAALVERVEIPGGLRLTVNEGSAAALEQLIDIERGCCAWITFALDGPVVSMTADGEGESVLRSMWVAQPV